MRILKPNKPSASGVKSREQTGGLPFTIEEFTLDNSLDDGSDNISDASPAAGRHTKAGRRVKGKAKVDAGQGSDLFSSDDRQEQAKKEYSRLLAKGIRLLSMREHSVLEITNKLSVKCLALDIVHTVVEDLIEKKYLSNQRFTESYVRSRQNRGFGPSKIRKELLDKGIKNSMIDDYINANSAVWFENAENQYQKKFGTEPVKDYNNWAKRARFLQSRGFSMDHIQVTVPRIDHD